MFDRKSRLMLILALLNDAYGDVKSTVTCLQDFIKSHAMEEIDEFGLEEILDDALKLEEKILSVMDKIKAILYK